MQFEHQYGNMTFKGKYSQGYEVLKGDDLRQVLWDMTHKPYKNTFVVIDEIDSEFPARMFAGSEQTEIALRLWHTAKLGNYVLMSSHKGNSTDLIIHLATHYFIYPYKPNFETNSMPFDVIDVLHDEISTGWIADDIIKTMVIYGRKELTENTEFEANKARPTKQRSHKKRQIPDGDIDIDLAAELGYL